MCCHCMTLSTIVERNHEIDVTNLDGEKVMMDLEKGQYFMLNEVSGYIWELMKTPISMEAIITSLMNEYEVEREVCESSVTDLLHNMHHANLVIIHA